MAIVCKKCKYVLTTATVAGFVASASAGPIFYFTKEIVLAYLQMKKNKGYQKYYENTIEDFTIGVAKQLQIICPVCAKFEEWLKAKDEEDIIEEEEEEKSK